MPSTREVRDEMALGRSAATSPEALRTGHCSAARSRCAVLKLAKKRPAFKTKLHCQTVQLPGSTINAQSAQCMQDLKASSH